MKHIVGLLTTNYLPTTESEITSRRPLAALPVIGRYRMLDFALSNMVNAGMKTVGLILPTNYRSIVDHVKSGKDWALDCKHAGLFYLPGTAYGMARRGNGHFLLRDFLDNRAFLDREGDAYVVVSGGSIIYNMDYLPLVENHIASGADITVVTKAATTEVPDLIGFAVSKDGSVKGCKKGAATGDMAFLDTFVISVQKFLELLDLYGALDHLDLFEAIAYGKGPVSVRAFEYSGPAFPVFSLQEFYTNSMRLLNPELSGLLFDWARPIRTREHDNPSAKYEPGAKISYSMVSGGSIVAGTVENSILGRNVIVEAGAIVKNSIIFENCVVKTGAKLDFVVVDKNNIIPEKTELKGTREHLAVKEKQMIPSRVSEFSF